ncbi:MAG: hypothetical protein KF681_09770 [Bdellovibrionaceae bacterium]|nr:hypothetical protein [Pseudobdellovibrionaceae bacterium]
MKTIIALLTLISSVSFAQQPLRPDSATPGAASARHVGRSEQNRADKKFQVTAQIVGLGPSIISSSGLQGSMFLDPNSQIMIEATSGSGRPLLNGLFGSDYEYRASSFGVHYKRFVANSFYWRGGVDYRTSSVDYKYTSWVGNPDSTYKFSGNSVALNFQIGNQWQFDGFTLGCDWVGYSMPIASNVTSEEVNSTDEAYYRRRMKDDQDDFLKNGHFNLVRFYLGASF